MSSVRAVAEFHKYNPDDERRAFDMLYFKENDLRRKKKKLEKESERGDDFYLDSCVRQRKDVGLHSFS